MRILFG